MVVEMGVNNRDDLGISFCSDSVQRVLHLLDALAGVDRDEPLRALDERLIR